MKYLLDEMYEISDWKLSLISRQDKCYRNHIIGAKMDNGEIIKEYYYMNGD